MPQLKIDAPDKNDQPARSALGLRTDRSYQGRPTDGQSADLAGRLEFELRHLGLRRSGVVSPH
jgi:hypothetical protein